MLSFLVLLLLHPVLGPCSAPGPGPHPVLGPCSAAGPGSSPDLALGFAPACGPSLGLGSTPGIGPGSTPRATGITLTLFIHSRRHQI